MNILTLTLSPAFDMHCRGQILPERENLVHLELCQAGGKGVNISRALTGNGQENRAILLLGQENQDSYLKNLSAHKLDTLVLTVPGRIRENITVHSQTGSETRISFPGFTVSQELLSRLADTLLPLVNAHTVITMTGRLPEGLEVCRMIPILQQAVCAGAKIVVDSRSFSMDDLLELKPWLIKPNQEEISAYLGREVQDPQDILQEARRLHARGIQNVMVSMGKAGALLVCDDGAFLATPPAVQVVSTIGAGDSTIAGFLAAAAQGLTGSGCLSRGVAFGAAACMQPGTQPPAPEDVQRILPLVQIHQYGK